MKLVSDSFKFTSGDILSPTDLNQVWRHASEAVTDTFSRRYKEVPVLLSFTKDVATGYTDSDSAEVRQFRFSPPQYTYITEAFLNGNITSNDKVQITIRDAATGQTPAGCTLPWLELDSTGGVAADVSNVNQAQFQLSPQQYIIEIVPLGTMTVNTLDLVFFVKSDLFLGIGSENVPSFFPTFVSDSSALDASVQDANKASFESQAASAPLLTTATPIFFCAHNINIFSSSSNNFRRFYIPRFYGTTTPGLGRALQVAISMSIWWKSSSPVSPGYNVSVSLYSPSFSGQAVDFVSGVSRSSGFANTTSFSSSGIYQSSTNASTNTSIDFYLEFSSSFSVVMDKVFGVLWVA